MKKIIIICLFFVSFFISNQTINAQEVRVNEFSTLESDIIYFEDGSYLVTNLYSTTIASNSKTLATTSNTIVGNRDFTLYANNGSVSWKYTVTGYFTVNLGVSSIATSASYQQTIFNNSWKFKNGSTSYSGNTVYGYGTYEDKLLFITLKTVNVNINVSCDVNGRLY